jgi:hypothetical protein
MSYVYNYTITSNTALYILGTIPVELGACQELEFLSLAGNKLQGNDHYCCYYS